MTNEEFSKRIEAGYETVDLGGELGSAIPLAFVEANDSDGDPSLWVWGLGDVASAHRYHRTEIYWSLKDESIRIFSHGEDAYSLRRVVDFAPLTLKGSISVAPKPAAKAASGKSRFSGATNADERDERQYTAYQPVQRARP